MSKARDDRASVIRERIGRLWRHTRIHVFNELESTNAWLTDHIPDVPTLVVADSQTRGRGRQGRYWVSPRGGLYFSIGLPLRPAQSVPPALSLLVGLQLVETLHANGYTGIRLKWPNDLMARGAKLAGLLVERLPHALIIGVGINVQGDGFHDLPSDRRAIGLRQLAEYPVGDALIGTLAGATLHATTWSSAQAERLLQERWPVFDVLAGRDVVVEQAGGAKLAGHVAGVTRKGELRLITDSGEQHLLAGECRIQGNWASTP